MLTIVLLVVIAVLVSLCLFLFSRFHKEKLAKESAEDEARDYERETRDLKQQAEDLAHNHQTINRLQEEAIENFKLIHMLQRVLIESLESDLKDANNFLEVALEKLSRVRPWQGDDILMTFISNTRARIRGENPLVHSQDPVQGLHGEGEGNGDDPVQLDGEGDLQAPPPVPVNLQVAGQAQAEPGR